MNYDNDNVRQPDEAIYDTLIGVQPAPVVGRRPRRNRRTGVRPTQSLNVNTDLDTEMEAALQASMITLANEQYELEMQNVLRESAEQYERDCMAVSDAESLANVNIDRELATAKIQCLKLGRLDADYRVAYKWITGGCLCDLDKNICDKLLQIRLPNSEKTILTDFTDCYSGVRR